MEQEGCGTGGGEVNPLWVNEWRKWTNAGTKGERTTTCVHSYGSLGCVSLPSSCTWLILNTLSCLHSPSVFRTLPPLPFQWVVFTSFTYPLFTVPSSLHSINKWTWRAFHSPTVHIINEWEGRETTNLDSPLVLVSSIIPWSWCLSSLPLRSVHNIKEVKRMESQI